MKIILAIAGSDSCGGAGIQADIKTITGLGAHALTVITALTAQNSQGISDVYPVPERFIARQLNAVLDDVSPHGVKIGMLYSKGAVKAVVDFLRCRRPPNVVLDPVARATTGRRLMDGHILSLVRDELLPLVAVVTPNLGEAGLLSGKTVKNGDDMLEAGRRINAMGPAVIVTGGHLEDHCEDLLVDGKDIARFAGPKIRTPNTHGSGCVFSSALATYLGGGKKLERAAKMAHEFARRAIENGYECGKGPGPVGPGFVPTL
ncbi:MAG: bifunctional hydroxymethylpyrimidine kinase/phosphomethylpyrimidine kinase [Deltaproteobacteria bacterium]|nr:bifunctional hydroxymethylpyrimidine kinase/phosphomethylpyrimidine kinase [Deltaproteobacteria bacterium]MBW1818042.1 bifunctional hydroxymethylpyrimidine kinase/phosphomethylpyrimidine kinase [Deltaproteobacteria bacterium]MBW2283113.1 bifunctional hydroxymethylpyrimidine kinase/phosphomethylpyrimidine kinase [Deltaproteobacteria bacterium]